MTSHWSELTIISSCLHGEFLDRENHEKQQNKEFLEKNLKSEMLRDGAGAEELFSEAH